MVKHASPDAADAFCATRLDARTGAVFGTLPAAANLDAILRRAAFA